MGKRIMNICFFNHRNRGDLHVSRTLVRYVTSLNLSDKYTYYHVNDDKILKDINEIDFKPLNWKHDIEDQRGYFKEDNKLYFNTWYKSYHNKILLKNGITIQCLYDIFFTTLKECFSHEMKNNVIKFLPQIDFRYFELLKIDSFIKDDHRQKILICNNNVESSQSLNFDFNIIIEKLSIKYPNLLFIVTNKKKRNVERDNVKYVQDITGNIGNDLNEISYLSTFCDILIGRMSGPHSFTFIDVNLLNPNKIFLSFIYEHPLVDPSFGVEKLIQDKSKRAKFEWSSDFNENNILKKIEGVINDYM